MCGTWHSTRLGVEGPRGGGGKLMSFGAGLAVGCIVASCTIGYEVGHRWGTTTAADSHSKVSIDTQTVHRPVVRAQLTETHGRDGGENSGQPSNSSCKGSGPLECSETTKCEPEIKWATQSEFQGYLRKDQASLEFVIPFSEEPNCSAKGQGMIGKGPFLSADRTHVWLADGDVSEDVEVYCIGVRGTDI